MSFRSPYGAAGYPGQFGEYRLADTSSITGTGALTYAILALLGAYSIIHYLDVFPTLPLSQLCWNGLVYAAPSSLVIALEGKKPADSSTQNPVQTYAETRTFAAKSEAMRIMLGLSGQGLLYTAQRSRRLSGLSKVFKHSSADSLPGLGNWDNSCYQNSILQGLASLNSLQRFLENAAATVPGADTRLTNVALSRLIEDMNNPKNRGRKMWTPAVLKSMSSWQQQDAQEYYSKVIDTLEKELNKAVIETTKTKGLEAPGLESKILAKQGNMNNYCIPVAKNPLEGMLAQRVGCMRCGYVEGLSLIPFICLTVPLGNHSVYDLGSCLDEYTSLEPITGVECPRCTLLRQEEVLEKLVSLQPAESAESTDAQTPESIPATNGSATGNADSPQTFKSRLAAVKQALHEGDFSDEALSKKCSIPSKQRVLVTKTRQAVIARAPQALVVHVNRSVFDDYSGMLRKNYANVQFPKFLDLSRWLLGGGTGDTETWSSNPAQSILDSSQGSEDATSVREKSPVSLFALRAVVTHQGRHENGHYIAFRRTLLAEDASEDIGQDWWRLSDEDVTMTNEDSVLAQGGVFMLFYEQATSREKAQFLQSTTGAADVSASHGMNSLDQAQFNLSMLDAGLVGIEEASDGVAEPVHITALAEQPMPSEPLPLSVASTA